MTDSNVDEILHPQAHSLPALNAVVNAVPHLPTVATVQNVLPSDPHELLRNHTTVSLLPTVLPPGQIAVTPSSMEALITSPDDDNIYGEVVPACQASSQEEADVPTDLGSRPAKYSSVQCGNNTALITYAHAEQFPNPPDVLTNV